MKVVGITFKQAGRIFWFNSGPFELKVLDKVVVETEKGYELANVISPTSEMNESEFSYKLPNVVKKATTKDIEEYKRNKLREKDAIKICKGEVAKYKLDMKILGVDFTLDGMYATISYVATSRVDFRDLIKVLPNLLKAKIEMRQIGEREGAKYIGALGICGRETCCTTHLREMLSVGMVYAKTQNISLGDSKFTGHCGKLICCLTYEQELYEQLRQIHPSIGDFVDTREIRNCRVIDVNYLSGMLKLEHKDQNNVIVFNIHSNEIKSIRRKQKYEEKS